MDFVNAPVRSIKPYKLASHEIWSVTGDQRAEMLKLDWNEATIPPSPLVAQSLAALVNDGSFYNLYPSLYNPELLRLLSDYLQLPTKNIQYFASSDSLHEHMARLYLSAGDAVLLLGPTYDNFRLTVEVSGGRVIHCDCEENLRFDPDTLYSAIDAEKPKMVYICNPNNPTGLQHSASFIETLLKQYPGTLFVVDEAYEEFSGISVKDLVLQYDNLLVTRTMSKAFALANFRFGYLISSKRNIDDISGIRNPKNISTFTQEAVIAALQDIPYMKAYVAEVNQAKKYFENAISQQLGQWIHCEHSGGNFQLLQCVDPSTKPKLLEYLKQNGIFVRDLTQTAYFRAYCWRVTIGTREQMQRVFSVMQAFFKEPPR